MADIISLARTSAPVSSIADTSNPEALQLFAQAENALSEALHRLRHAEASPSQLRAATARAIRAATALRRLSTSISEVTA